MRIIGITICVSFLFIVPLFSQNMLSNPGFEESETEAFGWRLDEFQRDGTIVTIEQGDAHSGNYYVCLENTVPNDARLVQTIKIEEKSHYKISAWIKAIDIPDGGIGANLSINEHAFVSREIKGTNGRWEYVEFYLSVTRDLHTVTPCLRLGGYGGTTTGKACFDDISMVKVDSVPGGDRTLTIGRREKGESRENNNADPGRDERNDVIVEEETPPVDRDELISQIVVYSLIFLSAAIFSLHLIINKPPEPEKEEE
jgi:hypothetical protein